ncbi:unnamed protein product [Coregonus sp. 'balchen']|nr:unnamed protein product [Coregonus sp. 'balchen']
MRRSESGGGFCCRGAFGSFVEGLVSSGVLVLGVCSAGLVRGSSLRGSAVAGLLRRLLAGLLPVCSAGLLRGSARGSALGSASWSADRGLLRGCTGFAAGTGMKGLTINLVPQEEEGEKRIGGEERRGEERIFSRLTLLLLPLSCVSCPSGCRCYSLTVECGSLGLREIPQGVPDTTQTIFLQDNALVHIRGLDLSGLGRLLYLYLQNNSISALEPGAFLAQGPLLELALNGNLIHLLTPDTFTGLDHLRILYLAANQITRLHDHTFTGLQSLQELHLQENSIERTRGGVTVRSTGCGRGLMLRDPPHVIHGGLFLQVCIPPVLHLEPSHLTVQLGESLRVTCQASGYPQPLVTWRKTSQGRALLGPRGLLQELGGGGDMRRQERGGEGDMRRQERGGEGDMRRQERGGEGDMRRQERGGEGDMRRQERGGEGDMRRQERGGEGDMRRQERGGEGDMRRQERGGEGDMRRQERGGEGDMRRQERGGEGDMRRQERGGEGVKRREGRGGGVARDVLGSVGGVTEEEVEGGERESFDPDTGSGMLFLSNVTVAHAGRYECKALNPGGVAHMTFHLAINMTSSTALWPRLHSSSSSSLYLGEVVGVSQEPLYEMESMDFSALGPATQTVIAPDDSSKEERILHVNNYSDGPTTSSQLEEYCDDAGHEMYVLNCSRSGPALPTHAGLLANQHAASLANQHTGVLANQQGVLVLQEAEEYCDDAGHEMYVLNCSRSGPALPTHAGLLANQHAASLANQHTGVLANQQGVLVLQEGIHAQVWKVP